MVLSFSLGRDSEIPVDRRIGQTLRSPPAKPGVYLTELSKYDNYNLIVSTHQKPSQDRNIFLFTGERVVEYEDFPPIDFFVIDEFYKLSLARDDERTTTLNQALYRLLKMTNRFYLLGPNIRSISPRFTEKHDAVWHHSNYATVAVDVEQLYAGKGWKPRDPRRKDALFELLETLAQPTIIYGSGPPKATQLADEFYQFLLNKAPSGTHHKTAKECLEIIEWVDENIHEGWCLSRTLRNGIAFHHGHLPRHLGSSLVDAFNHGHIQYLFCTSTLIEGVNTAARNVVLFDQQKGRKAIDFFDYKNIVGRSGRMNFHFVGKVFEFHKDPAQLELDVDVPLFSQANAPLELLVQLEEDDIEPDATKRLSQFDSLDESLKAIIRKNSGLPVDGQIALIKEIEANLHAYHRQLKWKTIPSYDELKTAIELCWKYLLKKTDSKAGVGTPAQLAYITSQYAKGKTIQYLIAANLNSDYWRSKEEDEDSRIQAVVLLVLGVVRQWFEYRLPKVLAGLSELQAYVFSAYNLAPGNYTFYSASLENSFFKGGLSVLMDYDIPASAIRKLERLFTGQETWDEIYKKIKTIDFNSLGLLPYEIGKLQKATKG